MKKFNQILERCNEDSRLLETTVDQFLLYYAADRYKLARQFDKKIASFRHVIRDLEDGWVNMFKSQYIGSQIFKQEGLINKIINHSALDIFNDEEMTFLKSQTEYPWRFSFSRIIGNPAKHFYQMEDVMSGEVDLYYSQSITTILQANSVQLWFTLSNFNGMCRQCYGPVMHFSGFEKEDIDFYATEVNNGNWISDTDELMDIVHENPIPFQMLIHGSMLPVVYHKEHQFVKNYAEYSDESFESSVFKDHFKVEYADSVYKMSLHKWSEFPHFAQVYYDENEEALFLMALTDFGFLKLAESMNELGYQISETPDFRVNQGMASTAEKILKRKPKTFEYDQPFSVESEEDEERSNKINQVMAEIIPDINAGKMPDVERLAKQAGMETEDLRDLVEQLMEKVHGKGRH